VGLLLLGGPEGYERKAMGMGNTLHGNSGKLEWNPLLGTLRIGGALGM
jgi:hypothetical protein